MAIIGVCLLLIIISFYYSELLRSYPDSLFVLTVREEESWYRSYSAHNLDIHLRTDGHVPARVQALNTLVYGTVRRCFTECSSTTNQ